MSNLGAGLKTQSWGNIPLNPMSEDLWRLTLDRYEFPPQI